MSTGDFDPNIIKSLPPAALQTIPAGLPPPGIEPNFLHPPTRVPITLGIGSAFLALALFCFVIRMYTRLTIVRKLQWDDLTISLGYMLSIVYFGVVVNGCVHGSIGRHAWDVHLDKQLSSANLLLNYVTSVVSTPALGLIKISLFIQYYLLFSVLRYIRISVYIGGTLSALYYVSVTIAVLVLTTPRAGESLVDDVLSKHDTAFMNFNIPTGVIGVIVDWCLLVLPLPAVLNLQLSRAKKLGIVLVFITGGLAAIASVVCLYYRVQLIRNPDDPAWEDGYLLLWSEVEMYAGVTASSMPTVRQFFSRKGSLTSLGSKWISNITHSLSWIKLASRTRLHDQYSSSKDDTGNHKIASKRSQRFHGRLFLNLGNYESPVPAQESDSHIQLTESPCFMRGGIDNGTVPHSGFRPADWTP